MTSEHESQSAEHTPEFPRLCRYLSERSPQPMVAVEGLTHIIRYVNPAFCDLVGKTRSEMIGRPFSEAVPEGERNGCLPMLERVFNTGEAALLPEQEHGEKPNCFWSYSVWAILDPDEQPAGVMIQITDSSEAAIFRRRALEVNEALVVSSINQHELTGAAQVLNQELRAATQAKSQFLATMSHEIRTPLNAILGFSELLGLSDQTAAERQTYGDGIKRNARLLQRLIDDILDLSKIEAGRLEIEKIDMNLPELLSDVDIVMRFMAEEKGLAFSMTAEGRLPEAILCDPTRLKQILTNVIGNAVKFTSTGSVRAVVKVSPSKTSLHVVVTDTGKGVTSEQAAKLFQPFRQGDPTTTRKFGGTGLGLDLARRLARALGGDVVLVENPTRTGCVFEITIALENARYELRSFESSIPKNEAPLRLDGISVLLAEDAPDNQFLMTRFLTLAGAAVDVANDGEQAVSMALSGCYDVVLMDIQMPKLDGYGATTRLRENGYKGPIVALTAHAMRDEIERCRLVGCDAHLAKPVSRQALSDLILRLVGDPKIGSPRFGDRGGSKSEPRGDLH